MRNQIADLWADEHVSGIAKPADYWRMFTEFIENYATLTVLAGYYYN